MHIDFPLSKKESKRFFKKLLDYKNIEKHRFLPMIKFNIIFNKHADAGKKNTKKEKYL